MRSLFIIALVLPLVFGAKFFIPNIKANWHKAHEFCHSLGMTILTVETRAKHEEVINFVKESDDKLSNLTRYWIGASDLAEDRSFTWVTNGRMLTFNNWARGEPNGIDGKEACVEMLYQKHAKYTWGWNDNKCSFNTFFICEEKASCISPF
ncbi:CD209 antigen-like protein 2 [Uranotaenia lowii]|uniref:CD209 antigen-like protein 2 n=1 Tax=Uranotaenia lowii TaxID=190385 RepID=UPI002479BA66|nr:CD209 antigen-like protein 2 [Uranotaenia lowii]